MVFAGVWNFWSLLLLIPLFYEDEGGAAPHVPFLVYFERGGELLNFFDLWLFLSAVNKSLTIGFLFDGALVPIVFIFLGSAFFLSKYLLNSMFFLNSLSITAMNLACIYSLMSLPSWWLSTICAHLARSFTGTILSLLVTKSRYSSSRKEDPPFFSASASWLSTCPTYFRSRCCYWRVSLFAASSSVWRRSGLAVDVAAVIGVWVGSAGGC